MKQRIRHIFPHNAGVPGAPAVPQDELVPRGWITPQGHFLKTKEHWASITAHFRRPDARSAEKTEAPEEAEAAERNAHLAYSISITSPTFTWNEAMLTRRPLTEMWPWLMNWRAANTVDTNLAR